MDEVKDKILEALKSLEDQGEIVITSNFPDKIAEIIFNNALETWIQENLLEEEPIETTMPYLLEQTIKQVIARFSIQNDRARKIVNNYYNKWLESRSVKEIAEIYWHETPKEMARRAYYHIELGNSDGRDLDYLEWRKCH